MKHRLTDNNYIYTIFIYLNFNFWLHHLTGDGWFTRARLRGRVQLATQLLMRIYFRNIKYFSWIFLTLKWCSATVWDGKLNTAWIECFCFTKAGLKWDLSRYLGILAMNDKHLWITELQTTIVCLCAYIYDYSMNIYEG